MDFSKLNGTIYFVNKFVDSKKAKIHVLNHSLHFASSIFEGIGVYDGKPLFLKEHLLRLKKSAKIMKLQMTHSIIQLEKISWQLIKKNKIKNGYIRPIIFRSSHSMSPETRSCKSQLAIAAWKWGKLFTKSALSLEISKYPKLNEKIYPINAKSSGGYQTSVLARSDLEKTKYDDCLMLDLNGNIAETSACNIFWIKNNIIYTSKEHSILNGITRRCIIQLCKINNIKIRTGNYSLKNLYNADSVFMTGTAAEIQLIKNIRKKKFNKKSEIIDLLKNEYENIKKISPNLIKHLN